MNPAIIGVLVLLLIVAGVTIGFLMMKPKNVQATATKKALPTPAAAPAPTPTAAPAPTPTAAPAPTPEPKPSVVGKAKPVAANVSTKKARLILTTKYVKGGCEGKVVSDINLKSGIKLDAKIGSSLPKGQYACCAQIENMKADKVDIKFGKTAEQTWKDVDFPGNHTMKLTHIKKIPGGEHTVCADSFEGTFRISQ